MPSSTLGLLGNAVNSSLKRKEERMDSAIDKKLLLSPIEFGPSECLDTSHLNKLRSKYIVLKAPERPKEPSNG